MSIAADNSHEAALQTTRRIIARHKLHDTLFGLLGVLALSIAFLTFAMLFGEMARNGLECWTACMRAKRAAS